MAVPSDLPSAFGSGVGSGPEGSGSTRSAELDLSDSAGFDDDDSEETSINGDGKNIPGLVTSPWPAPGLDGVV